MRHGVRAVSLRVSQPPKRQPAQWRLSAYHANAVCTWEATARKSHNDLKPKARGRPPEQYPSKGRRLLNETSAARRAPAACSCVAPHLARQPAQWPQWRLFACYAKAGCALEATARKSHHDLAPKNRGLPPIHYPSKMRRLTIKPEQHGAHLRHARVFRRISRDSQRSGACSRATRRPGARWRSQLARRTTVLH